MTSVVTESDMAALSLKHIESNRIFPVECGKEYDYKRPSYKCFSTTDDQTKFDTWRKQRFPNSTSSVLSSQSAPSNLLVDHLALQSTTMEVQPEEIVATTEDSQSCLASRMEVIRRQMMQRQGNTPMRLKLYQSRLNKIINAVPAISNAQPPVGWKARYPEPRLKTPPRVTSAMCQTKISAPPVVSLSDMEVVSVENQLSQHELLHGMDRARCSPETSKQSFRPKTAPPMIYSAEGVSPPPYPVAVHMEPQKRMKTKSMQTTSQRVTKRAVSSTGIPPPKLTPTASSPKLLEATPIEKPAVGEGIAVHIGTSTDNQGGGVDARATEIPPETDVCDAWTEISNGKLHSKGVVDDLKDEYDRALKKFGWRMEVPGDPYNIKKQIIPPRKSISVTLKEPEVLPQAPTMQSVNKDTFFHCVIPQRVLSFEISPDFVSQHYNAYKENLRRQGKWNYADKNFSFIY